MKDLSPKAAQTVGDILQKAYEYTVKELQDDPTKDKFRVFSAMVVSGLDMVNVPGGIRILYQVAAIE